MADGQKTIDGSRGEGGGQILRTSMALAAITGTPLRLENIRANRSKPGLMRQHLTAVRAAAEICGGELEGDELRASALEFRPGEIAGGEYHFAVGTAGSAALVLQTVMPALLSARQRARLIVEGGTHAMSAPPYHFLEAAYGRAVRDLGASFEVDLDAYGFYPAGGGRIVADVGAETLQPFEYLDEEPFEALEAIAVVGELPTGIAERELAVLRERFADLDIETKFETLSVSSRSAGNVLHVRLLGEASTEVFTEFGKRGRPAEDVAATLAERVLEFLERGVPVGEHLADQLLVLGSAGAGGRFRTVPLSLHSRTMLEVIPEFVDVEFGIEEGDGFVEVEVRV